MPQGLLQTFNTRYAYILAGQAVTVFRGVLSQKGEPNVSRVIDHFQYYMGGTPFFFLIFVAEQLYKHRYLFVCLCVLYHF